MVLFFLQRFLGSFESGDVRGDFPKRRPFRPAAKAARGSSGNQLQVPSGADCFSTDTIGLPVPMTSALPFHESQSTGINGLYTCFVASPAGPPGAVMSGAPL